MQGNNRMQNNEYGGGNGFMQTQQGQGLTKPFLTRDSMDEMQMGVNKYLVDTTNYLRNQMAWNQMQTDARIQELKREPKKKVVTSTIYMGTNGSYVICPTYEDGSFGAAKYLFGNVRGEFEMRLLKFPAVCKKDKKYVVITWKDCGKSVVCDSDKMNKSNLYKWFIEAEITFCAYNSERQIKDALYGWLVPKIIKTVHSGNILEPTWRAGWTENDEGRYEWYYAEKSRRYALPGLPDLPVQSKHFDSGVFDKGCLDMFFSGFLAIKDKQYRIVMLEMLLYGILSSVLNKEELYSESFINFVVLDGIWPEQFCRLYQIFNREKCNMLEADDKQLYEYIRTVKDEVIILHKPTVVPEYTERKVQNNLEQVINKICKQDSASMGIPWKVNAGLVVLNDQMMTESGTANIVVDLNGFQSAFFEMLNSAAVDAFLAEFIRYATEEMPYIKETIQRQKKVQCKNLVWNVIYEILGDFGQKEGINVYEKLQVAADVQPSGIWGKLMATQDVGDLMVKNIRDRIKDAYVQEKAYGCRYRENCCYYDEQYFWIPIKLFWQMMYESRIPRSSSKIQLVEWKTQEKLLPDENGLTYRLRLDQKSIQTYCFKKNLFNADLCTPIEELGKEVL